MADGRPPYHEGLLHWIWENQHYLFRDLTTNSGQEVEVHSPGTLNRSDGPDFKRSVITIGNLRWHGDVEIHWQLSDWDAHGHATDANFNRVILHVVFDPTNKVARRSDRSPIPTLCLSGVVSKPLQSFIEQYRTQPMIPCAGHLPGIPEEVFIRQLNKAHREYFEQKVDTLLQFYDPSLAPSAAWTKMLVIALFDGLGITYNRVPMQHLARRLWEEVGSSASTEALIHKAFEEAGVSSNGVSPSDFDWKHKGARPGNQPVNRIQQGVFCLWHIYHLPFDQWTRREPPVLWEVMMRSVRMKPAVGRERSSILFGTVFLPALFMLGNLQYSESLKSRAWHLWQEHRALLPSSLLRLLENTVLPPDIYRHRLGTIHQLRAYCRPRHCQDCEVFKNIISS